MKAVMIRPRTSFKSVPKSDTLWGMLVCAHKRLFGERSLQALLEQFVDDEKKPPFVLSSCYLFDEIDGEALFFLPRPKASGQFSVGHMSAEMLSYFKEFKKIKYLALKDFEELINAETDESKLFERFIEQRNSIGNEMKIESTQTANSVPHVRKLQFVETLNLHNSIDRMRGSTLMLDDSGQLYWEESAFFGKHTGFYFLIEGDTESVIPCLRYLSHTGLGGNNSIGKGAFEFQIADFTIRQPKNFDSQLTLSLYSPRQSEIASILDSKISPSYDLVSRQGHTAREFEESIQKNSCIVFGEGSRFVTTEKLRGKLIMTAKTKSYDVYNNYLGFTVNSL